MNISLWEDLESYIISDSIRLFIPDTYIHIIKSLKDQSLDPEQQDQLDHVLQLLHELQGSPYSDSDKHLTVCLCRTEARTANYAILEGLQQLEKNFTDQEVLFFTQSRHRLMEIEHLGFMGEMIHIPFSQDYHDLFWTTYTYQFNDEQPVTSDIHPVGIDSERLWLISPKRPEEEERNHLLDSLKERFPVEAMFRSDSITGGGEITYSLPIEMIRIIIGKADDETKDFIDSVYETWIDDVSSWIETNIDDTCEMLEEISLSLLVKNNRPEVIHHVSITCSFPESLHLLGDSITDDIQQNIPKMPILTQKMLSDIDAIPPETYLKLFGGDLESCNFSSPTYEELQENEDQTKQETHVIYIQDHSITFTVDSLLPYEVVSLPITIRYGENPVGDSVEINCLIDADEMEESLNIGKTLKVITKQQSVRSYIRQQVTEAISTVL